MVPQQIQVPEKMNTTHTKQEKVKKLSAGGRPASGSPMVKSNDWGNVEDFSQIKVSVVSYLESESLPMFIGLRSGVSNEIPHVVFPHILGRVSPCYLCHFLKMSSLLQRIFSLYNSFWVMLIFKRSSRGSYISACRGFSGTGRLKVSTSLWLSGDLGNSRDYFRNTRGVRYQGIFLAFANGLDILRVKESLKGPQAGILGNSLGRFF